MTITEQEEIKANNWIIFPDGYEITEAMNRVFKKDWIREFEDNIFKVPENQLTEIGKIVMKRLIFARDMLGIEIDYDIFIQIFQKVKQENISSSESTKVIQNFKLKEALANEDYETAQKLIQNS